MTLQFSPSQTEISVQQVTADLPADRNYHLYRDITKRGIDLALTLIAAPVVVPLIALMAFLVMMDGHNPFYSQMRIGRNGKSFRIWKLRTMVPNAEALLESYLAANPEARAEWDSTQKLKSDPRITWIGGLLRKISMDELPQLLNVLNGTMSLVGPRPMMVSQRDDYAGLSYNRMTPGITGLWQVSDRNDCDFDTRAAYDDTYFRTMSFMTDLRILLKTVTVVLRGTGY